MTGGIRNSVNLFPHKSNMDWVKRDLSTRAKRQGGKAVNKEKDKDLGKQARNKRV